MKVYQSRYQFKDQKSNMSMYSENNHGNKTDNFKKYTKMKTLDI